MEYTVEKQSGNKVKISFKTPAADFEAAVEKAYLKNRGRINVPGFRKGKAPRKLIERMYGEMIFYDDALELLFPDAYMEAIQKEDLHPVSQPELSVDAINKGEDVAFSCEVFVQPEVKLGEYKGLEVTRTVREVPQSEIDDHLKQEQKRVARSVEVTDRPVENGDEVNLDYSGSVDGVKFEGGTAQGQKLLIGSNSFIPGFEEQMLGMAVGEEKDLQVKFPEEYHAENLKGKDAVFNVKVNAITREELPALDDDFASEVSDFDTLADYTADLKAKLQVTADAKATEEAKQRLIQKVVDAAEIDIPAPMVEEKLSDILNEMDWRLQQQGLDIKRYMQLTGQTEAQMRDMYREEARNNLKTELVIEEIIKGENIEADEKDTDAMLEEYAKAMGKTLEAVKADFTEAQIAYFQHRSRINKVLDMMWDSAKVTDEQPSPTAEPEQAAEPAKKPAAKKTVTKKAASEKAEAETEGEQASAPVAKAKKAPAKKAAQDQAE
ncbi:MAG TPA: trigger factor [Candidatus Limiplasma sp.]|nr:trigger factor [Candidatus Limiplasma sp.]HPS81680.1 trigger factor [Candidatus Limiplasma sp.]